MYNKTKGEIHMPEMKNICGKIPVDLHEKVRQEIEKTESSTQKFIQQVIEEHFMRKGECSSMAARTIAVQVTEELFGRLKEVLLRKGCKQKDFLIGVIEQAIAAEEAKWKEEAERAEEAEGSDDGEPTEADVTEEPESDGNEEKELPESLEEEEKVSQDDVDEDRDDIEEEEPESEEGPEPVAASEDQPEGLIETEEE